MKTINQNSWSLRRLAFAILPVAKAALCATNVSAAVPPFVDIFATGAQYHAQVTPYFCAAASMEMELDCDAVRAGGLNPFVNNMLNAGDGNPVPLGAAPPAVMIVGGQVTASAQTYIYNLVHGLNSYNGFTYLNPFWPPGSGTETWAQQYGLNLLDSPFAGGPGLHNYASYNLVSTLAGGDSASRTIANALMDYQIPAIIGIKSGAHAISVYGVRTDVRPASPVRNKPYKILGFWIHDPWDGWVNANPFVTNPRTGQPVLDRNGNKIPYPKGLDENRYLRYGYDLDPNGILTVLPSGAIARVRLGPWFTYFNPSPGQPGTPPVFQIPGYKFEVEPVGPEQPDTENGGALDSFPTPPSELTNELTSAQADADASSDIAADTFLSTQPGFENGSFDSANEMFMQFPTDSSGDGDWLVPYEGPGGTNDVTGFVLIDAATGVIDEAVWMNPGDTVPSMTLAEVEALVQDEASGNLPIDDTGAPTLNIQDTGTNSVVITWPLSVSSYSLEQNPDLTSTNWVAVPEEAAIVGGQNQVIVSPPVGNMFYRLNFPLGPSPTNIITKPTISPGPH
jgi:hypothetical protein